MKLLTFKHQRNILGRVSKALEKTEKDIPDYAQKMLSFDKVYCYKCYLEIEINQHYQKGGHTGPTRTWSKYYHGDCYEALFH